MDIREALMEDNPTALFADGFDDAIIGVARRCSQPSLVAYSYSKAVAILCEQGLSREEATEHMEFNVVGAWMGENTPVWIMDADE
jgi:hypothetical protein